MRLNRGDSRQVSRVRINGIRIDVENGCKRIDGVCDVKRLLNILADDEARAKDQKQNVENKLVRNDSILFVFGKR